MKILSICCTDYNLEQAKGIIYWLKGDKDSQVLRLPNIHGFFCSYFILAIYFIFLQWFTFFKPDTKFDRVIVIGRSVVAQSIIIAHQLQTPLSTQQKPFGFPYWFFKSQYVPYHDLGKNIPYNTITIYLAPNTMEHRDDYKLEKKVSILIGGSLHNKYFPIVETMHQINNYLPDYENYYVDAIVSRRTPNELIAALKKHRIAIVDIYGATKKAYISSEVLLITDDSFCMISEAIQAGRKPIVLKTGNIGRRLTKGINYLKNKGLLIYEP